MKLELNTSGRPRSFHLEIETLKSYLYLSFRAENGLFIVRPHRQRFNCIIQKTERHFYFGLGKREWHWHRGDFGWFRDRDTEAATTPSSK